MSEAHTPTRLRVPRIRKITLSAPLLESSLRGTKTKRSDLTKENKATGWQLQRAGHKYVNGFNPHRDPVRLGGSRIKGAEVQVKDCLKSQLVVAEVPVNVKLDTEVVFQIVRDTDILETNSPSAWGMADLSMEYCRANVGSSPGRILEWRTKCRLRNNTYLVILSGKNNPSEQCCFIVVHTYLCK